jgi:restriction system protein
MDTLMTTTDGSYLRERVLACPICGWWLAEQRGAKPAFDPDNPFLRKWWLDGASGRLRQLDTRDLSQPIEEVKNHLLAQYECCHQLHPRLLEQTVASVFRTAGFDSEATAFQKDGGIDVILRCGDGSQVGVQVKRSKNKIHVAQIRELAGALISGKMTSGIFVTTSSFTSVAVQESAVFAERGLPIELIDAKGFLDMLRINQRAPFTCYDDWHELVGDFEYFEVYSDETA